MFEAFVVDAISYGDTEFYYGTCEGAQRLLIQFNLNIESVITQHGLEAVGNAIWYMYGPASGMIYDVLDESVADGFAAFYKSMETLYDNGFAKHCENKFEHSHRSGKFGTACYMIWDMNGIECLSFNGSPEQLGLVESLIDFGLDHHHAVVQESFLHCLGHKRDGMPEFVDPKLAKFLNRNDLAPEIRDYAEQCQTGCIL